MQDKMVRVSRKAPCPICKKTDWCGVSPDGAVAICMRVQSDRPTKNGGWLHRLKDAPPSRPVMRTPPPVRSRPFDAAAYHAALRKRWTVAQLSDHALELGVGMDGLGALAPAWDAFNRALAFPMRDGTGTIVGIRLRARDGRKWAVCGSKEGLFFSPDMANVSDLVVCEGPTDTAAAISMHLDAVGRPSCAGAVEHLVALVRRLRVRSVTIVADHDEPKERHDGSLWSPGLEGAQKLAHALGRMYRIILPPGKDLRSWWHAGATRGQFDDIAAKAKWRLG